MSHFIETGEDTSFPAGVFTFPGFGVSWAGSPAPWRAGLCFGSEDGRIRYMDADGQEGPGGEIPVTMTGEAINGVAFTDEMVAVSTRSDVNFWHFPTGPEEGIERITYSVGAHGIIASRSGKFMGVVGGQAPKEGKRGNLAN